MSNLQVWNCSLHSKIVDHNRTFNSQKNSQQPKLDFFFFESTSSGALIYTYYLVLSKNRIITTTKNTSKPSGSNKNPW